MPWNVVLLLQHLLLLDIVGDRWKCDFQVTDFTMVVVLPWELNSGLIHMNQMFYHEAIAQGPSFKEDHVKLPKLTFNFLHSPDWPWTYYPLPSDSWAQHMYWEAWLIPRKQHQVHAPRETRDDSGGKHIPISGILWSTGPHYLGMCSSVDV